MTGGEEISRLFQFRLEMLSDEPAIDHKKILGQNVTVSVELPGGATRHFNGIVSSFTQAGQVSDTGETAYQAEVVPWLWLLTRTADIRIFEDQTVPEIIERVFADLEMADFVFQLDGSYSTREYVVQYRETDFNFVSRLMEEEGIFYYFEHTKGKHTLVLGDSVSAYGSFQGEGSIPFTSPDSIASIGSITSWERQFDLRSEKWSHTDYDFKKPSANLLTSTSSVIDLPITEKLEIYDYPGGYTDEGRGSQLATIRMQEEDSQHDTIDGVSHESRLQSGLMFTLDGHPQAGQNGEYMVISVAHTLEVDIAAKAEDLEDRASYENEFKVDSLVKSLCRSN